jgi:hypothetical protein
VVLFRWWPTLIELDLVGQGCTFVGGGDVERTGGLRFVGVDGDGLAWYRSSACSGNTDGQVCLEVARRPERVFVRCSRLPSVPPLVFASRSWSTFVLKVKALS